jgi:hypothetical protein
MGQASNEGILDQERRENGWLAGAHARGIKCLRCDEIPPYCERDTYFETGMCGPCWHAMSKA